MTRLPLALLISSAAMFAQQPNGAGVNSPWTASEVIHVEDLAKLVPLQSDGPLLLQIGFTEQYNKQHIPGAVHAGPARDQAGLDDLKKAVENVPKDREIVLYCGCCPWDHCPNMKPAYNLLHSLGYKNVRITEIPTNFQKDWVEKGFPVEGPASGSAPVR